MIKFSYKNVIFIIICTTTGNSKEVRAGIGEWR